MCSAPSSFRLDSIISLAQLLGKNLSALDVGCGTGVLIPSLLKIVGNTGKIFAIDPADKMLVALQNKYPDPRIKTLCETLEDCSITSSSLDAIICFSCFPHIDDKQKAISNSARMLKGGGRLVIAHVSSRDEINAFHSGGSKPVRNDFLPNKTEMTNMLMNAGFIIEHFIDEPGRYEIVAKQRYNTN